ncbi:MAG: hypothetical protein CL844_04640 [Crocinitomicaceae bacterium]|nr:hypothetical protein [Crocinitomicaceae bacterium]
MKIQLLISVIFPLLGFGQEVISSQGNSYSNSNTNMDFTIGEVIINTETDGTHYMTQGFHQTNWFFSGLENHTPSYEAIIFPNPTEESLNIKTSTYKNVVYTLYDAQGKLVMQNELFEEQTSLQVSHLAPGKYSLVLNNKTDKLKTFKLIKHK